MSEAPIKPAEIHNETELISQIRDNVGSEHFVSTTLRTDERVIARVTDGIYRQPGSALRELISNAYDADASRVVINTDAPRFERISIEDNGHGMTPEVLAHLVFHIGGSAKRSDGGRNLGITDPNDPFRSPNGRRLIGKIGIGLFSVSQLTHSFQIITKVKDDPYRTITTVILKQYQDEDIPHEEGGKHKFESGKVNIWREKAADTSSHGTTVILTGIKPEAKNTLRSRDIWDAIEQDEKSVETNGKQSIDPPKFHIGRIDTSGQLLKKSGRTYTSLPWDRSDAPEDAFRKMVQAVWEEIGQSSPNPQLNRIFDYYLRMIWQLALAAPLPYVEGHLFDMVLGEWAEAFEISNSPKGVARRLGHEEDRPIRKVLDLSDPVNFTGQFDIYFDDLKLLRPIKFKNLPTTSSALKKPLVFLGKCREEFLKVPRELRGGTLAFEAYLFWTPKIAPTEHQGSLIRIHGSSGTLFDSTFMRYQVAELTRLRQITCEIFVTEGLDGALNIDRESFNNAHPHSVYITKWLHKALRQLATAQKKLASEARDQSRDESKDIAVSEIQRVANDAWVQESDDPASKPPSIEITDTERKTRGSGESYVFTRSAVVPERTKPKSHTQLAHEQVIEEKLKAVAQVLASFGLLDSIPKRKQEKLLKAIYKILDAPEK
jgi:Histidine kinase-, DNA gyrase B-, and HSP90-like ATPase